MAIRRRKRGSRQTTREAYTHDTELQIRIIRQITRHNIMIIRLEHGAYEEEGQMNEKMANHTNQNTKTEQTANNHKNTKTNIENKQKEQERSRTIRKKTPKTRIIM